VITFQLSNKNHTAILHLFPPTQTLAGTVIQCNKNGINCKSSETTEPHWIS